MDRDSRLLKNTILYFVGNFATKVLSFILVPFYTAYLTVEDFGKADLYINLLPLIGPLFTLQVTECVFRFLLKEKNNHELKKIITNSIMIFVAGIFLFTVLFVPFIYNLNLEYGIIFILYFITTYFAILLQQILRGLQKNVEYAITGVILAVANTILCLGLLYTGKLQGSVLLIAPSIAALFVSIYAIIKANLFELFDKSLLSTNIIKEMLSYGLPLIPNQISWWGLQAFSRYVILQELGLFANGLYAVASKFPAILTSLTGIFFLAWTENAIMEYETSDRNRYYSSVFNEFAVFSGILTATLMPVIHAFNIYFVDDKFAESIYLIPIMLLGTYFCSLATFMGSVYTASMKTMGALRTTIVACIINVILTYFFIRNFGIYGSVTAGMLAYLAFLIVRIKSVNTIVKIDVKYRQLSKYLILIVASSIGYFYNFTVCYDFLWLGVIIFLTYKLNKNLYITLFSIIKNKIGLYR